MEERKGMAEHPTCRKLRKGTRKPCFIKGHTGCDQYGFGDGTDTSTVNGDSIQFEAVTTSPTKGKMTWKGTVKGDKIEVGYVWVDASHWYKPNPKPLEKWAKGELKR